MSRSLITIVVPVYKVEKYLARCVDSLLRQTYEHLEIILVDDGSPDHSGEICDQYAKKDHRITVIHQENKGLSGARNAGITMATGDYIAFVDSDDFVHEKTYEILMMDIKNNKGNIAICNLQRFSDETRIKEVINDDVEVMTSEDALNRLHGHDGMTYAVAWNKLYERKLFDSLRYPLKRVNEDEFLTYKLLDRATVITYNQSQLYYYFINDNSITTNSKYLLGSDIFKALEERKKYFTHKNQTRMVTIVEREYLNRTIIRYKMQLEAKHSKNELKTRHNQYKKYFDKLDTSKFGLGYKIFNRSPKLYFFLVGLKYKEGK